MTVAQLQAFLAVADRRSFTRAAEDLVMSQSAVSHALASLEDELGGPLLERGPGRPVKLTELGRRIEPHAREILLRASRISEEASSWFGLETGTLRIASVASIAARTLPPILARFRDRHPKLEVVVLEGADFEVHDLLVDGLADVGFLAIPLDGLSVVGTISEDALLAVLPEGHRLAELPAIGREALAAEPFIMSAAGCAPLIVDWFRPLEPRVAYEVNTVGTMMSFIRGGLGVTIMPELVHPADLAGVAVRPLDPAATRRVVVAFPVGAEPAPAATAFLREVLPDAAVPASSRSGIVALTPLRPRC